jgi:hypothetical protein
MMGAVTGVNAAGIYVSVNALRSQDKGSGGIPVELLLRQILESAHTLDQAIALVQQQPVLVPDLYLIADGKGGESAVVERTPLRAVVRRSRDVISVTNHALGAEFRGDSENDRLKRYLTSGARLDRLDELLQRLHGRIDPAVALQILRDKRGVGDRDLGLGNRNALDAIIATHSVVVDATNLVLWVSTGPHALGRYVAFDLRHELLGEDRLPPADLPEDPTLRSPEYRDFVESQRALTISQSFAEQGRPDLAIEEAARAVALAPKHPDARKRLADLLWSRNRSDDRSRSRDHYQAFLTLSPPHLHDIETVQALLK